MASKTSTAEELKLAIAQRQGVATAVADLYKEETRILTQARKDSGENWRAAVSAMAKWRSSMLAGDMASARRALVDIAKLELAEAPVDNDTLLRIQTELSTNVATAGLSSKADPDTEEGAKYRAAAWRSFLRQFPDAASNETTLGTLRAVQAQYGDYQDAYVANDSTLLRNWAAVREKAARQEDAIKVTQGYASAIQQSMTDVPNVPNVTPEEGQRVVDSIQPYAPNQISGSMAAIERMAASAPSRTQLTEEERSTLEDLRDTRKGLEGQLTAPLGAMPSSASDKRDRIARIVSSERFQWWAERNGFDVGTVFPGDAKDYSEGVVTPSGVYVPGPDDNVALQFLQQQMRASKDENAVAHPILHRRLSNEKRAYGVVGVEQPDSVSPVADADRFKNPATGMYSWYTDPETGTRYSRSDDLVFWQDDETNTIHAMPASEYFTDTPEDKALQDALLAGDLSWKDAGVYYQSSTPTPGTLVAPTEVQALYQTQGTPPTESRPNPPLEVYGEFLAPTSDDPVGSIRMRTEKGDRVIMPDEIAVAPEVTTGGGPRQTLARFVELARGRMAHNKAENNAYEAEGRGAPVTPQPADRAAEAVVPDKYSEQERKRNEARNLKQADTEDAQELQARVLAQERIRTLMQKEYARVYAEALPAFGSEKARQTATARADALLTPALVESQLRAARGTIRGTRPDAFDGAGTADERAVAPAVLAAVVEETRQQMKRDGYTATTAGLTGTDIAMVPPAPPLRQQGSIEGDRATAVDRRENVSSGALGLRAQAPAPTPTEPPKTNKTEPPKTESPKTEPPKTEPPKTEPPKTEPPKTEPPKTEPPKTESPKTEVKPPNNAPLQPPSMPLPTYQPPAGKVDEARVAPPAGAKGSGQAPLQGRGDAVPVPPPVPPAPPAPTVPPAPQGRMPPMPTPESEERARQEKEAAEAIDAGQVDARRARSALIPAYGALGTDAPETRYSVGHTASRPPMFSRVGLLKRRG